MIRVDFQTLKITSGIEAVEVGGRRSIILVLRSDRSAATLSVRADRVMMGQAAALIIRRSRIGAAESTTVVTRARSVPFPAVLMMATTEARDTLNVGSAT